MAEVNTQADGYYGEGDGYYNDGTLASKEDFDLSFLDEDESDK